MIASLKNLFGHFLYIDVEITFMMTFQLLTELAFEIDIFIIFTAKRICQIKFRDVWQPACPA
jgi:hypothetical protein